MMTRSIQTGIIMRDFNCAICLAAFLLLCTCTGVRAAVIVSDDLADPLLPSVTPEAETPILRESPRMGVGSAIFYQRPTLSGPRPDLNQQLSNTVAEVRRAPDDISLGIKLGDLYLRAGRRDEAAEILWRTARINPSNIKVLEWFAFSLLSTGDDRNSLKLYQALAKSDQGEARHLFNLASIYYNLGEIGRAIELWKQALISQPQKGKAFFNIGVAYITLNRSKEAAHWLSRSYQARPDNPFVMALLTRLYQDLGEIEKSERMLSTLSEFIDPGSIGSYLEASPSIFVLRPESYE